MCEILFITGFDRIYRIFKTTFYPTDSIKIKKDEIILMRASRKIYNFLEA